MNYAEFQVRGLSDPRLAVHAASPVPAWLWSADGTRILWTNLAGARVFGADGAELESRNFGPADPHRRQIARLASRLPASGALRMERLRGFGVAPGMLGTCGCSRLDFPDGSPGVPRAARAKKTAPPVVTAHPCPPGNPAPIGDAPAEFALFDAIAEDATDAAVS